MIQVFRVRNHSRAIGLGEKTEEADSMKTSVVWKFSLVLFAALALLVACGAQEEAEETAAIAVVFATGGLGDQSFNDAAFRGMQQAGERFGIEYDYAEPSAVADYDSFLDQFAASGRYALIVSIGFDQADALGDVASRYPEQQFAIVDMVVDAPNVASFVYAEQERGFLMGVAAALATQDADDPMTNSQKRIGVIGGMQIPLIDANIAGYIAGAKWVDRDVQVSHSYVGDWADPARGKELAISMIENGVDVVWGAAGRSGLGVLDAAREQGVYGMGADSEQDHVAPGHILTNGLKLVDETVLIAVEQVLADNFQPGIQVLGVADGALGYSESLLSAAIIERLEDAVRAITAGEVELPDTIEAARAL
ncbi:MAG: BMP family ABC transporter substrate-binding protein [Spirochaetaceae bacterium]|nr:MAG: BMP family ABC transporter substrate-binding protein [Spirochaetaceae bacterium]